MNASVQSADDGSIPGVSVSEKQQTYAFWQSYNMDKYYESVEAFTFRTLFIAISQEDVRALLSFFTHPERLDPQQKALLDALSRKMDQGIAQVGGEAFAKLSSRSPKDAVDKFPELMLPILREQLQLFPNTDAGEYLAMRYSLMLAMRVKSAHEALRLFSFSSRIISDFQRVRRTCSC